MDELAARRREREYESRWTDTACDGCGKRVACDRNAREAGATVYCTDCWPFDLPISPR